MNTLKKYSSSVSKLITLFIFLFLLTTLTNGQVIQYPDGWGPSGTTLTRENTSGVEINFSINTLHLEDINIEGQPMIVPRLPEVFLQNNEGAPNLPGDSKIIMIPQGARVDMKIISYRTEIIRGIEIAPAPRIPKDNDDSPLFYRKNPEIYSQNKMYPESPVLVSEPTKIRGIDFVMLGITPFQYNPITKELIIYRDLKVQINFIGGNGKFGEDRLRSRWWDPILQDAIFNRINLPQIDYSKRTMNTREAGCEYLIIRPTGTEFAQWADSIKNFRTFQGILTKIVTITEAGGNNASALETYINNAYNTWTIPPTAVLMLGDYGTSTANNLISPIWNNYCVSDNILADVTGNSMPDIIFARMTANDAAQLQVMVTKFINHERTPPTNPNYYANPITALGWQTSRWFQICSETVGGYWKNSLGKFPVRINAIYSGNPSVDPWSTATNTSTVLGVFGPSGLNYIPATPQVLGGWTGGNATMVNNAINSGCFFLQHRDHGGVTGWGEPAYYNSNINGLTNTDLVFVNSINCLTGKYNYSGECFTEKFHRYTYNGQNSGALGLIAASEVSYSFVNDTYVWGMMDNMWPNFMPQYGTTPSSRGMLPAFGNAAGKYFLQQSSWPYNTNNKEVTYNLFHLHGDAFMHLYSQVPQNLTVSHNPVIYTGATSFAVTANAGSFIALTLNGAILGTATGTGSPVNITIPGTQLPPDYIHVTVTKENYYRYNADVEVISGSTSAFPESFELTTFPPEGWTKFNVGGGSGWNRQTIRSPIPGWTSGTISSPPGGQNAIAFCTWNTGGTSSNDQWLLTPQLSGMAITDSDSLIYWVKCFFDTYADTVEVRISTTTPEPQAFTHLMNTHAFAVGSADTLWTRHAVSLENFVGQNIFIAWREKVSDNYNMGSAIGLDIVDVQGMITGLTNNGIPAKYELSQNYPNPFNPTTTIKYAIPRPGFVSLKVYDVLGKEVVSLVNQEMATGYYSIDFDGSNLGSGVYFYRIESAGFVQTKKMLLIK